MYKSTLNINKAILCRCLVTGGYTSFIARHRIGKGVLYGTFALDNKKYRFAVEDFTTVKQGFLKVLFVDVAHEHEQDNRPQTAFVKLKGCFGAALAGKIRQYGLAGTTAQSYKLEGVKTAFNSCKGTPHFKSHGARYSDGGYTSSIRRNLQQQ